MYKLEPGTIVRINPYLDWDELSEQADREYWDIPPSQLMELNPDIRLIVLYQDPDDNSYYLYPIHDYSHDENVWAYRSWLVMDHVPVELDDLYSP